MFAVLEISRKSPGRPRPLKHFRGAAASPLDSFTDETRRAESAFRAFPPPHPPNRQTVVGTVNVRKRELVVSIREQTPSEHEPQGSSMSCTKFARTTPSVRRRFPPARFSVFRVFDFPAVRRNHAVCMRTRGERRCDGRAVEFSGRERRYNDSVLSDRTASRVARNSTRVTQHDILCSSSRTKRRM